MPANIIDWSNGTLTMHKKISKGERASKGAQLLFATLALIVPLLSGCSAPRDNAQAQPTDGSPTALVSTPPSTVDVPSAETPTLDAVGTITTTGTVTGT